MMHTTFHRYFEPSVINWLSNLIKFSLKDIHEWTSASQSPLYIWSSGRWRRSTTFAGMNPLMPFIKYFDFFNTVTWISRDGVIDLFRRVLLLNLDVCSMNWKLYKFWRKKRKSRLLLKHLSLLFKLAIVKKLEINHSSNVQNATQGPKVVETFNLSNTIG